MVNLVCGHVKEHAKLTVLATRIKTINYFCKQRWIQVKKKFELVTNLKEQHM